VLRLAFRRVRPGKEERLRSWLAELGRRADEVRATFADETTRHEQAFLLPTPEGTLFVYAIEAGDPERGRAAYAASRHPIDLEHRRVMQECLGERLELAPLYDVALPES